MRETKQRQGERATTQKTRGARERKRKLFRRETEREKERETNFLKKKIVCVVLFPLLFLKKIKTFGEGGREGAVAEWRWSGERERVAKRRGEEEKREQGRGFLEEEEKKGKKEKTFSSSLSHSSPQKSFFPFPLLQPLLPRFRSPPFRSGKAPTSSRSTLVGARRDTDSQTGGKRGIFSCSCLFCFLAFSEKKTLAMVLRRAEACPRSAASLVP